LTAYLNEHNFKYLFQALVRPHLEYAAAVWSPYEQHDIDSIENVQRRVTKQIPSLKGKQDSSAPRHFGIEKDSSAPRKFGIRTNLHRIFFQTN
jgi:hypothetical protein